MRRQSDDIPIWNSVLTAAPLPENNIRLVA
jgi:hypothetical protein